MNAAYMSAQNDFTNHSDNAMIKTKGDERCGEKKRLTLEETLAKLTGDTVGRNQEGIREGQTDGHL